MKFPKPVFLLTVPHTGTTSTRRMLEAADIKYRHTHFNNVPDEKIERLLDSHSMITTYRNLYLCTASWINRQPTNMERDTRFMVNWTKWGKFVKRVAKVVTMDKLAYNDNHEPLDKTGARAAYLEGDMDRYFEVVPLYLIEHATDIIIKAGYDPQEK